MKNKIWRIFVLIIILIGIITIILLVHKKTNSSNEGQKITLISPNGSEIVKGGSTFTIKWSTQNIPAADKISISIRRVPPPPLSEEGQEFDPLVAVNLENTGSYDWNVSSMYPEGNYILGINSYASLPITNPISDESDTVFRITKDGDWQTYVNGKFKYSVSYPKDWTYREFPDTKTGAGFRPLSSTADVSSECITIDKKGTAENEYYTPFDEYAKIAAPVEIQNYEKLHSIEQIKTESGIIGYKTTWIYKTFGGEEKISLPITYFENKKIIGSGKAESKYKTVQIILNNENCGEIYNQMLSTFAISELLQ